MDSTVETPVVDGVHSLDSPPGRGWAALAGAAGAGLALGLTELFAGLFEQVPSAIAAVGSVVVDNAPPAVERFAIELFGTADKGALAVGTAVIGVLLGALVGVASRTRPWVVTAAFAAFAVLGIAASLSEVNANPAMTVIAIGIAAAAGALSVRALLRVAPPADALPTDGLPEHSSRRKLIGGVAGVGVAALAAGLGGRSLIIERSEQVRTSIAYPRPRTILPPPQPDQFFDIPGLDPIVVPNREFYRIDTALIVPRPDPATWQLSVTGLVDNEVVLTFDDLLGMDLHDAYVTIACVSNEVGGDLVGNAKWTGVKLAEVLDMAGIQGGASQIVGRSVDGWTAGFPTDVALDGREPLIAIGMNDELLPPSHGFPARLIVPGLYGYVSATKWLDEIHLTTWDAFDGYWIPRGWAKSGPIKTQSRIDTPRDSSRIPGQPAVIAGVAWAPTRGVGRVDVSIDGGRWHEADITTPLSDQAWVQWKFEQNLEPGRYQVQVRATDGAGETQTEVQSPPAPSGATGYHTIQFNAT